MGFHCAGDIKAGQEAGDVLAIAIFLLVVVLAVMFGLSYFINH